MNIYPNRAELKKKLEKKCSAEELETARGDAHASREKSTTMLPIISGKDCPYGCTYCYIQTMGYKFEEPQPLKLTPEQVCYALLENKEFIPGRFGTTLAFGHISEPLLPRLRDNTLSYFKAISSYLGNPIQFATKMYLTPGATKKIQENLKHKYLSPLVTITTLARWKKLEPYAPSPEERLKTITNLTKQGYKVFLYLRPLIPGVVDYEIRELLEKAKSAGAVGVVCGGFRVTLPILKTMRESGIDTSEIANRIPKIDKTQRYIYTKDLEEKTLNLAKSLGLVALRSTKCAAAYVTDIPCTSLYWVYNKEMCTHCRPCAKDAPKLKKPEIRAVLKEVLVDYEILDLVLEKDHIEIKVKTPVRVAAETQSDRWQPRVLETYFRKRVVLRKVEQSVQALTPLKSQDNK